MPPRRVLVIALRRIGDLLLATALLHSLRMAWPDARIELLVNAGTEGILQGNPDIDAIHIHRRGRDAWRQGLSLLRRYDLSISLQQDDRAQFLGMLAARCRASIVPVRGQPGSGWKRWINHWAVDVELHWTHIVIAYLMLAEALGVPPQAQLVPPRAETFPKAVSPFAVIHPTPMFPYKAWTTEGWSALIRYLHRRGLGVALTGGPTVGEQEQVAQLCLNLANEGVNVTDHSGRLSFGETADLLRHAAVFIGPDTSITHLAAACGTPTVALFGPSSPTTWGPWPCHYEGSLTQGSPWVHRDSKQQRGNVWLVQGTHERRAGCIPCLAEGCEKHRDSGSDCLTYLAPARVIEAVEAALAAAPTNPLCRQAS